MRVLVTGSVSKHCNPKKNHRDVMVSWLIAECLRDLGHEVEHRNPSVLETYDEFDHVFLGISAFHALGANRTYGVLAALLRCSPDRVTLFVDDPQLNKIMIGLRSFRNNPERLFKPFYTKRLEYDIAIQPGYREWLSYAVEMLHDYAWPTTIVPVFPWADIEQYRTILPNAVDMVGVDFTPYVPEYVGTDEWAPERKMMWVTEAKPASKWFRGQRPVLPVQHYGRGLNKRPLDRDLALLYSEVWGVLDPGIENGFFNSRMLFAAQAGALYITNWRYMTALGAPYSMLADAAGMVDQDRRIELVMDQITALHDNTWKREQTRDAMKSLLMTKVDA